MVAGYRLAGLPLRMLPAQFRPLLWMIAAIAVAQLILADWQQATAVVATLVALVLAAGLVSATTTMTELTDLVLWLVGPLGASASRPSASPW